MKKKEPKDCAIILPVFTLTNNKWIRGGIWGENSRLIPLYDFNSKKEMVRIGTGIY